MNRILILLACLGFPALLFAQNDTMLRNPAPGQPSPSTTQPNAGPPATPVPPTPPPPTMLSKVRFGAYIAPTINWMKPVASTDDKNTYNVESGGSQAGFIYGLMMDYFFAENYAIATGLQVNQTGGHIICTNRDQSVSPNKILKSDFKYKLQYLEIPVNLKLRTDDIKGFRFFGQAGLSIGFNISRKVDYKISYVPDQQGAAARDTSGDNIKLQGDLNAVAPVLFAMNLGIGTEYTISKKLTAYLGIFFNNGFAPDATEPENFKYQNMGYPVKFDDGNTRLNNLALRLGLFF